MSYEEAMTKYIVNGSRGEVVYDNGMWSYRAPHKQVCTLKDAEYTQWPCDEIKCSQCKFYQ